MPLLPTALEAELQKLVDSPFADEAEAITAHAAAFRTYMEGISNPVGTPVAHDAGEAAFISAAPGQSLSLAALQAAYVAYVGAFAPLVVPYVATPPPGPPPLAIVSLPAYALSIDTWLKMGTASIPPVPPVPWA